MFFLLVLWLGICVEVDVDRITILPPLPIFFPTHNFFVNASDSYLKLRKPTPLNLPLNLT